MELDKVTLFKIPRLIMFCSVSLQELQLKIRYEINVICYNVKNNPLRWRFDIGQPPVNIKKKNGLKPKCMTVIEIEISNTIL